jgi:O-antigen/teichoic acid export membrane protein
MTDRTLRGFFWTFLATGANAISLLLVVSVLARLLTPADFGLAAVALMVIGFSAIFSDFGVGPAVVQRKELRAAHVGSALSLSIVLGSLIAAILWLTSGAIADFFQLDELRPILRTLAVIFPVQGLSVVSDSLLQRELRFRQLAMVEVVTYAVGYGAVGIVLALWEFAAWALIGAHLTQIGLRTMLLLFLRPHAAWPLFERRASRELIFFGGGFTIARISNYVAGQAENLVIGRWLGPAALGVYGRAYQLMAGPAVLFGNVLDRVLFPTMVHVQDQPERLAGAYRRGVALIALVILPISSMVVALAPEVVRVLLGSDWDAVILPLQILGVGMLFRTSSKMSDALVRATGAVYRRSWRQTAYAVLVFVGAIIGQFWGVEGVAAAVLVTLALNYLLMAHLSLNVTEMSWRTYFGAQLPGLASAMVIWLFVVTAAAVLRTWNVPSLLVLVCSTLAVCPFLVLILCLPNVFLGPDGQWMVRKLLALALNGRQSQFIEGTEVETDAPEQRSWAGNPIALLRKRLSEHAIRYCRWKSRVDVGRLLNGTGDLDLLVDRQHAARFVEIAEEVGFAQVFPCFEPASSQEAHLYALDDETASLIHLHVNFALLHPDISPNGCFEELLLCNSTRDDSLGLFNGMPVVQPPAELVVFVLRTMEQYSRLGSLPRLIANDDKLRTKLQILLDKESVENWRTLLDQRLPVDALAVFAQCLEALKEPTPWPRKYLLAKKLMRKLRESAPAMAGPKASFEGGYLPVQRPSFPARFAHSMRAVAYRLWYGRGSPKQLPHGGLVIAIIGPDASGKSTMVSQSAHWLSKVFRVKTVHLGKPPSTWLTLLPNNAGWLLGRVAPKLRTFHQRPAKAGTKSRGQGLLYHVRAVLLAWDRRALALRVARLTAKGWLVISDRYPTACVGAPDSARLHTSATEPGKSRFRDLLSRLENRLYSDISDPGIVVRLKAPLDLSLNRNRTRQKEGKEGDDFVASRHGDFFMPPFGAATVFELDTSTSLQRSIVTLRTQLWQHLRFPPATAVLQSQRTPILQILSTVEARRESLRQPKKALIVEFIGITGVGKSTLVSGVVESLEARGLRVGMAEDVILACSGLAVPFPGRIRSMLVFALSLRHFCRYFLTRPGSRLTSLAFGSIMWGMGNLKNGVSLARNFVKRIGAQLLLEDLCNGSGAWDILIWDEGPVHAAHNLFVHLGMPPHPHEIVEFAGLVPKPEVLVWVTAPTRQSVDVLLERGHPRVRPTPEAVRTFVENAATTFEVLSSVKDVSDRVVRLDNSADVGTQNGELIRARADSISEILVKRFEQFQRPLQRPGAKLCLTA